jgi:hypothetical protein
VKLLNSCLILLFSSGTTALSQPNFHVAVNSSELRLQPSSNTTLDLEITNNSDNVLNMPVHPILVTKKMASTSELGVSGKVAGKGRIIICAFTIDDVIGFEMPMVRIKPGATATVHAVIRYDCFKKKGRYKMKFHISQQKMKDGKPVSDYLSSNSIKIRVS